MSNKKRFLSLALVPVILILLSVQVFSDCDMIALVGKRVALTQIAAGGGDFDDPMDFYLYFGNTFIVAPNDNGYGIIYRSLSNTFKVYETAITQTPAQWNAHADNQIFRQIDTNTGGNSAYHWAQFRIFNEDGQDHRAYVVLGHARNASGGNENIPDPHPFVFDYAGESTHYAFEHNGTVDKQLLRAMTEQLWQSWNPGQIWSNIYPYKTEHQGNNELVDSEAYFHWLVCNIKLADNDVLEGLRRALIPMRSWNSYKNFVFSDRLAIYAYKGLKNDPSEHYLGYVDNAQFYGVMTGGNGTQVNDHELVKMDYIYGKTNYTNFDNPIPATVPYSVGFEESGYDTCGSNWYLHSNNTFGRIVVSQANEPYAGTHHLTMDSNTAGQAATNCADLYVNLANQDRITLKFYWKHFTDDFNVEDGIYFSDNNGNSFTQVHPLDVTEAAANTWYEVKLDIDSLCLNYGLTMNANFVIRFQQRGSNPILTDGFAFDAIQIYRRYAKTPYTMGFEDGSFDENWGISSNNAFGRIQVTNLNAPYAGLFHMTMDVNVSNNYAINSAMLYVDFTDCCCSYPGTRLKFRFKDFQDETHALDGIYFSDDGGLNFTRVYDLTPGTRPDGVWQEIDLDVVSLATANNLELTSKFVIKFQQYDNFKIGSGDGFAFDDIQVYRTGTPICW
ncbi:MAG: hypothetical protein MUF15_07565 [Acidobacteria bacterium]|jgi:hypothetical protein|nr:hypothetical protein [Acidobacteriota bacterium]